MENHNIWKWFFYISLNLDLFFIFIVRQIKCVYRRIFKKLSRYIITCASSTCTMWLCKLGESRLCHLRPSHARDVCTDRSAMIKLIYRVSSIFVSSNLTRFKYDVTFKDHWYYVTLRMCAYFSDNFVRSYLSSAIRRIIALIAIHN